MDHDRVEGFGAGSIDGRGVDVRLRRYWLALTAAARPAHESERPSWSLMYGLVAWVCVFVVVTLTYSRVGGANVFNLVRLEMSGDENHRRRHWLSGEQSRGV
jgi:hypothetical protein